MVLLTQHGSLIKVKDVTEIALTLWQFFYYVIFREVYNNLTKKALFQYFFASFLRGGKWKTKAKN